MNQAFGMPYPMYQGMVPNMMGQLPNPTFINTDCSNNTDTSSLENRISNLEKEVERLKAKANVEFVLDSTITKLNEDASGLTSLEVTNKNTGETRTIEVSGLFVAIGQAPDNEAFSNVTNLDEKGYIKAGEDLKTGTEGIFTAGDCRTKAVRQLTTAASDGAVAALAACGYIDAM